MDAAVSVRDPAPAGAAIERTFNLMRNPPSSRSEVHSAMAMQSSGHLLWVEQVKRILRDLTGATSSP
jgi:hypothetical protein